MKLSKTHRNKLQNQHLLDKFRKFSEHFEKQILVGSSGMRISVKFGFPEQVFLYKNNTKKLTPNIKDQRY